MVQKRSFSHSRRAQVTIFMIVGLLLLFIAIFLIQLTSSIKKEQLTNSQEKVFGNLFQKEGLRIGVEDCFHDILQDGIILLGSQGRIWSDQPGGSLEFVEGITGITPPGSKDRIAYAITNEIYPPDDTKSENPYPCDEFNKDQPCPYIFPDSQYGFGEIQLRKDVIEKDLLAYTADQIGSCINELITSKTSSKVIIEPGKLDLQIKLENDGINVQVKYPLTLKLGGEELFHIADFDFFYDSLFKSFLDSAVIFPLQWDKKFVEFAYDEKQLKDPFFTYTSPKSIPGEKCTTSQSHFSCQRKLFNEKFNSLDISLEKKQLDNGDTLFIFTLPSKNILDEPSGKYTYQFARQNRPPALDYIHRSECPEKSYDYLVIPGDKELGNIDIMLNAIDADEDEKIDYRFDSVSTLVKNNWPGPYILDGINQNFAGQHLLIESKYLQEPSSTPKVFSARAKDAHGAEDSQEVRVLIDRPIKTSFSIDIPYTFKENKKYSDLFDNEKGYGISQEDPFFLTLSLPEKSNLKDVTQSVFLTYENKDIATDTWKEEFFSSGLKKYRSNLKTEKNNFEDLTEQDLKVPLQSLFKTLTDKGKLKLSFSAAYCSEKDENKKIITPPSQEATIQVKECIPHYNPDHPYPYIIGTDYYTKKYPIGTDGKADLTKPPTEEKISPFLATHICCDSGTWKPKIDGFSCYTNPEPDCYTSALVEEEYEACDGKRGNICGNGNKHYRLYSNYATCGDDSKPKCKTKINKEIDHSCAGKTAFSIVTNEQNEQVWCSGSVGCNTLCTTTVIDVNEDGKFGKEDSCSPCTPNNNNPPKKCYNLKNKKPGICSSPGGSTFGCQTQ